MSAPQPRPLYVPHIPREQYSVFRNGLPPDERLPAKYDDWLNVINAYIAALQSNHATVELVRIGWDDFNAFAQKTQQRLSYALMTVYAIRKASAALKRQKHPKA